MAEECHHRSPWRPQGRVLIDGVKPDEQILLQVLGRLDVELHTKFGRQQIHCVTIEHGTHTGHLLHPKLQQFAEDIAGRKPDGFGKCPHGAGDLNGGVGLSRCRRRQGRTASLPWPATAAATVVIVSNPRLTDPLATELPKFATAQHIVRLSALALDGRSPRPHPWLHRWRHRHRPAPTASAGESAERRTAGGVPLLVLPHVVSQRLRTACLGAANGVHGQLDIWLLGRRLLRGTGHWGPRGRREWSEFECRPRHGLRGTASADSRPRWDSRHRRAHHGDRWCHRCHRGGWGHRGGWLDDRRGDNRFGWLPLSHRRRSLWLAAGRDTRRSNVVFAAERSRRRGSGDRPGRRRPLSRP